MAFHSHSSLPVCCSHPKVLPDVSVEYKLADWHYQAFDDVRIILIAYRFL